MKVKKNFVFLSALALLLLSACAPASATSQALANEAKRQISVNGVGQVYVAPDIAYINVGVRSQADTVSEALEQNKAQAQAIKETLVSAGIEEKDIQTSSFNVYPQSEYDYQGTITGTFFVVENNVFVTVRELNSLGEVLDAVAKSGANNIYGISFDLQDKTSAQSQARALAVESARSQAQELAELAGVELGEILSISTSYSYPTPYYGYGMGVGGGGAAVESAVPIAAGQMQISADVTIIFEIQ